jgi:hypothetical protein
MNKIIFICEICEKDTEKIYGDYLCRECQTKKLSKESYLRQKENGRKEKDKLYHEINKEKRNQQAKEYYEKNREKIRAQRAQFHIDNPENRKEQQKKRREIPEVKLEMTLRRRARRCLVYGNRCMQYLGCSIQFLKLWFNFQFSLIDPLMTLENHGSYWEIDHVKPVSTFDLKNEEETKACFNWKNVSPLEKSLNKKKSNKILDEELKKHKERIALFMTYCKDNNITENFNETLDTAGLL